MLKCQKNQDSFFLILRMGHNNRKKKKEIKLNENGKFQQKHRAHSTKNILTKKNKQLEYNHINKTNKKK